MKKEKVIEAVKNYLNEAAIDAGEEFMSKVWSTDLEMDETDLNSLICEIEESFVAPNGDTPEIVFNNREQMETLADSTVEEIVSFILSQLQ